MNGPEVLGLVALIAACAVYLFVRADVALNGLQRWREWVRAVDEWERARRRL